MTDRGLWRSWWQIVGLLMILALTVRHGVVELVDQTIATWAEGLQHTGWEAVAGTLTFFGSVPWCVALMGLMTFVWWGRHHLPVIGAFWGVFTLGLLAQAALRLLVAHWRPDAPAVPPSDLVQRYDLAGFTSGHAYRAAFLYGWWALRLGRSGGVLSVVTVLACVVLALVVGFTRVMLGRHWLTDVVGGWLLAATALQGAELWLRKTRVADA